MSEEKVDIRRLSVKEIGELIETYGERSFRAKQIHEWLWKRGAGSFEEMTNLSVNLRARLAESHDIRKATIQIVQQSEDGTAKIGFGLHDDRVIEGVLIPTKERITACVSSQVGCTLQCAFCATGLLKRERNLEAGEIYDQIFLLNEEAKRLYGRHLTNIVFMGMGEPLLNTDNVLLAIEHVTSPEGLGMASRRITVSTVGIARQIIRLAEMEVKFNLALSLHAATDEQREKIMPINKSNSIDSLVDALNLFYK